VYSRVQYGANTDDMTIRHQSSRCRPGRPTLAVGASWITTARPTGGRRNQADNSLPPAGAVYMFLLACGIPDGISRDFGKSRIRSHLTVHIRRAGGSFQR